MKSLYCLLALVSNGAFAATPGHFVSGPNYVDVKLQNDGGYSASIHTENGQSMCDFADDVEEVDEGDMRFHESGCSLRIFQHDTTPETLSVAVSGCDAYCGAGSNLQISKATKR